MVKKIILVIFLFNFVIFVYDYFFYIEEYDVKRYKEDIDEFLYTDDDKFRYQSNKGMNKLSVKKIAKKVWDDDNIIGKSYPYEILAYAFLHYDVKYDKESEVWCVQNRSFLPVAESNVIISNDGEILAVLYYKS